MKVRKSLLRILAVVIILGFLLAFVPKDWFGDIERKAMQAEASNEALNLVYALKQFRYDYGRFPTQPERADKDQKIQSAQWLMAILLGGDEGAKWNPKQMRFYERKSVKEGLNGLDYRDDGVVLVDPWGNPYVVVLDNSGDGKVTGPNGEVIERPVICYSLGADGIISEDDILSW